MSATWITNGRLPDGRAVDLAIIDGRIDAVLPTGDAREGSDAEVTDVGGWLLLPAMVEPHAHIDKALTAEVVPNPNGDLLGAIHAWNDAAERGVFTHDDMVARIRRALDQLIVNGVTAVRSHINCGERSGTTHLDAATEAIAPYADLLDIQLVALVHSPTVGPGSDANQRALATALERGAGLVGGAPHLEPDGVGAMEHAFAEAARTDTDIDLHTDETLDASTLHLRDLARLTVGAGREGRVTASHCVSLGMQAPDVQRDVARRVADAGIPVVTLPQTNLFLQGRGHPTATPRGLTAIHALREAGVIVAAGGDNVQDPFNLVGRSDPLETAALLVAAGHVLPDDAYEMVSNAGRRALGLDPVRFEPGDPADVVAIDAPSTRAAIADAPADRVVFRAGRPIAESRTTRTIRR